PRAGAATAESEDRAPASTAAPPPPADTAVGGRAATGARSDLAAAIGAGGWASGRPCAVLRTAIRWDAREAPARAATAGSAAAPGEDSEGSAAAAAAGAT